MCRDAPAQARRRAGAACNLRVAPVWCARLCGVHFREVLHHVHHALRHLRLVEVCAGREAALRRPRHRRRRLAQRLSRARARARVRCQRRAISGSTRVPTHPLARLQPDVPQHQRAHVLHGHRRSNATGLLRSRAAAHAERSAATGSGRCCANEGASPNPRLPGTPQKTRYDDARRQNPARGSVVACCGAHRE